MYKLKTLRSVYKRFKISSSGKLLRHCACKKPFASEKD